MRIAVISDIHGNLPALQAVVAHAGSVDAWWCLGDIVGYGADPNACVRAVRDLTAVALAGNHDLAAVGILDIGRFNAHAGQCLRWTSAILEPDHRAYLRGLAGEPIRVERERYTLVHASPRDPVWEYLERRQASACFSHFSTRYCLFGHTHVAAAFSERGEEGRSALAVAADPTEQGSRLLCNPGAVGQPRDGDSRASYLLIDEDRQHWEWRRVPYDVEEAAARIRQAGLPDIEAARLTLGR
ncbi:MAG TPA: metallophosphoesterase family protein [Chloroflexota bacterium]|nr:metallophosphoesterase family protein [Chloroflexota bacterium]